MMTDVNSSFYASVSEKSNFAPYLNLAQHNTLIIFEEIQKKLDIEQPKSIQLYEGNLEKAALLEILLNRSENPALQKSIFALLERYWSWTPLLLEHLRQQNIKEPNIEKQFGNALIQLIKRLDTERNEQTHYYHATPEYTKLEFSYLWNRAKEVVLENEYNGVEESEMSKLRMNFYKEDANFSKDGRIFFACLFLERADALYFINLFDDYKVKNHTQIDALNKAKILALTNYSAKLPQPKLQSGELHLDMLGELMRVPNEIFRNWEESQQEKFVTYDDLTFDEGQWQIVQQRTVMKRHDDRFPYFALRWLEENHFFEALSFHIHLGKHLKKAYPKRMNGVDQDRTIYEPIRLFAQLNDFQGSTETWQHPDLKVPAEKIEQAAPKYQITGNRIGFRFLKQGFLEHGRTLYNAYPAQPDAILSTYELANLCWYQLIYKTYQRQIEIEDKIRKGKNISQSKKKLPLYPRILSPEEYLYDFLLNMQQLYKDVATGDIPRFKNKKAQEATTFKPEMSEEEREKVIAARREIYQIQLQKYQLKLHYLPDDLRRYLLHASHNKSLKEGVIDKLKQKIRETQNLLKGIDRFEERDSMLKNKLFSEQLRACGLPRVGELATWLAKDFTYLKPLNKERKGKPNNQQYNLLQSMLALYNPYKREMFIDYLKELKMIGKGKLSHPFLHKLKRKINTCDYITDLYKEYLVLRVKWLRDQLKIVKNTQNDNVIRETVKNYINLKPYEAEIMKQKALNYKENVILLPRGLFNDVIKDILKIGTKQTIREKDNIVHLLGKNMDYLAPNYYDEERIYSSQDQNISDQRIRNGDDTKMVLNMRKASREKLPKELANEAYEKLTKKEQKKHQEKQKAQKTKVDALRSKIRFYKAIGVAEKTIRYRRHTDRVMWLMIKHLAENRDNIASAYNLEMANLKKIGFDQQKDENNKPQLSIQLHNRKVVAQIHLRQYGLFRRFMKDRRLKNLFAYFPESEDIVMQVMREELRMYDVERKRLMDKILEMEALLWKKYPSKLIAKIKKGHINHNDQLNIIKEHYDDSINFELAKKIRNAFNHNDIFVLDDPEKKILMQQRDHFRIKEEQKQYKIKPSIATYLVDLAVKEYEDMIRILES